HRLLRSAQDPERVARFPQLGLPLPALTSQGIAGCDSNQRGCEAPATRGERSLRATARRSLSPREQSAGAESGERLSPHPGEPLAGAAKPQIPSRRGATWYSRKTQYTGFFEARKTQNEWRAFVNRVFPYRK